jgi:hypothetical protein
VSTALQDLLIDGQNQRRTFRATADTDQLVRSHLYRIIDQNLSYGFDSWICHFVSFDVLILECVGSLAGVVEDSQTANDVTIVNAHCRDEDGTIEFITDGEKLWVKTDS